MQAQRLDGKRVAEGIQAQLKERVAAAAAAAAASRPGLAIVRVGDRKDSESYVNMKRKAAEEVGFHFVLRHFDASVSKDALVAAINELNADPLVHGIIVQLPLPAHLASSEREIIEHVHPAKDVDGFHQANIGALGMKGCRPHFAPATPKGVMTLLDATGVDVAGKRVVVVGRSNIVGLPVALLMLGRNATLSICHSRTTEADRIALLREADVVVAAVGVARLIRGEHLKPGAVVIDCGINAVDDPTAARGYRLVGDVDFASASDALGPTGWITPVPGGVGPMTIASLLQNTFEAFEAQSAHV